MQTKELGKNVCGQGGAAPALTEREAERMSKMIEQEYRVRMVLDNLPVTMFDLDSDVGGTRVVWGGAAVPAWLRKGQPLGAYAAATCCRRLATHA